MGTVDTPMRDLPTGTITLVFSDMEASTRLLQQLGSRWGDTLSEHRALLRAAYRGRGGHEMGTEGDSFFVVFGSASDAVRACVDGQRALAAHDWPAGIPVRVRMGMHTGTPVRHEDGYIGIDVHTGARIAACAHGGQVLVSDATRHAVQGEIPTDISFLDLGWHRLKDLPTPIQLHQLTVADLQGEFPPVRSLGAPTNLPDPRTSVVGRVELVEHVCSFLQDGRVSSPSPARAEPARHGSRSRSRRRSSTRTRMACSSPRSPQRAISGRRGR